MKVSDNKITLKYKNKLLTVFIKYSLRKTIGIKLDVDKTIQITAPVGTPFATIKSVAQRKSNWIFKQIEKMEKYQKMDLNRKYESGQTIKLLGREYRIKVFKVENSKEEKVIKQEKFVKVYLYESSEDDRVTWLVQDWYRNEALIYLAYKFEQCYQKIKKYNIPRPFYYLRTMKRRWGSCTPKGDILLNPEIIKLPSHCIEYIIMHELCHLKHKNHSNEFYNFLDTVMPSWKHCSEALDSFLQV